MRDRDSRQSGSGGVRDRLLAYGETSRTSAQSSSPGAIAGSRSRVVLEPPLVRIDYLRPQNAIGPEIVESLPSDLLQAAIHGSSIATIILDSDRLVRLRNSRAASILERREPLYVDAKRRLRVSNPMMERPFSQFLDDASGSARGLHAGNPTKFLFSEAHVAPVSVSVSAWRCPEGAAHRESPWAVLYIRDPSFSQIPSLEELRAWFGLTKAEGRLACAIASGKTIQNYSLDQDLSLNTVKTQFQSILDKTRVHRQVDLVRLLSAL